MQFISQQYPKLLKSINVLSLVLSMICTSNAWTSISKFSTSPKISNQCNELHQDQDIEIQTRMLFELSPLLSIYHLKAHSSQRTLTLEGTVHNKIEKELAGDVASLVEYVKELRNQIVIDPSLTPSGPLVKPGQKLTDSLITSVVKSKFLVHHSLYNQDIHVRTTHQIVILTGSVNSEVLKNTAFEVVSGTKGVLAVKNKLRIIK